MLLDHPDLDGADLSSLRNVVYGGSPMYRSDLVEAIERIGPVFCQLYAQGESPMTITYLRREEHRRDRPDLDVLSSAGIPRTGMEVRIADADDRELPAGEPGEIQVRGARGDDGLLGTAGGDRGGVAGGWLHTGDVGRLDERGYLLRLDRLKDIIITGGSNVYAREVEDVLWRHPAVHDAAVFGIPDRLWGEAVTAVVVAAPETPSSLRMCRRSVTRTWPTTCAPSTSTWPRPSTELLREGAQAGAPRPVRGFVHIGKSRPLSLSNRDESSGQG